MGSFEKGDRIHVPDKGPESWGLERRPEAENETEHALLSPLSVSKLTARIVFPGKTPEVTCLENDSKISIFWHWSRTY